MYSKLVLTCRVRETRDNDDGFLLYTTAQSVQSVADGKKTQAFYILVAELSRPADARFHLWPRSKSEGGKKGTGARQCPVVSVNLNGSERVILDDDGKANVWR